MIDSCDKLARLFPKSTCTYMSKAGIQAYEIAYQMAKENGFLMTERGKELLPHIRNFTIEFQLMELSRTGAIPFTYKEEYNAARNSHHGLLVGEKCILTASQVKKSSDFPRSAIYRGDYAENNTQLSLFEEYEIILDHSKAYVILTHGGYKDHLTFARFGFPENGVRKWAGNQMAIFDRSGLIDVSFADSVDVKPIKPSIKKLRDFVGDRMSQRG